VIASVSALLSRTFGKWSADRAPQIAAALTYYVLLSVAPLLILLTGVAGRLLDQALVAEQIYDQAYALAGTLGEELARELVSAAQPDALGDVGSVVALAISFFAATQVFRQLRIAFDRMWDIPAEETPTGGAWEHAKQSLSALGKSNLAAFMILLACGGLLVASLVLSSVIAVAAQWIAPVLEVAPSTLRAIETVFSMALVTVLFAVVYRYLPRASVGWGDVWVGAIATSVLFMLGRVLLGVYFSYASPGSAYGAAGSVVALLIWTNLSLQLLLVGAEFTHAWAYTLGSRAAST